MNTLFWQRQIYAPPETNAQMTLFRFFRLCEESELEKTVLDCGAGGKMPPLYIFRMCGYKTWGVDISEEQIRKARTFCQEKHIDLGIEKGDMRNLPFEDHSFSFAYSWNTIYHMPKKEIAVAMKEMKRVLRRGGILYVNFLSVDDIGFGKGRKAADREFIQDERGGKTMHTYFEDGEPDQYFDGFELLLKQKRLIRISPSMTARRKTKAEVRLDYIARKK